MPRAPASATAEWGMIEKMGHGLLRAGLEYRMRNPWPRGAAPQDPLRRRALRLLDRLFYLRNRSHGFRTRIGTCSASDTRGMLSGCAAVAPLPPVAAGVPVR